MPRCSRVASAASLKEILHDLRVGSDSNTLHFILGPADVGKTHALQAYLETMQNRRRVSQQPLLIPIRILKVYIEKMREAS